jgi:hypothetical protein
MGKPRTEASRELSRARANTYWADPARRKAHGEKTRYRMDRPEVRAKISENTKVLADPEVRERQRSAHLAAMADPAVRQKITQRTKAGVATDLDRKFADLLCAWSHAPGKVRRRFVIHVLAGWSSQEEAASALGVSKVQFAEVKNTKI